MKWRGAASSHPAAAATWGAAHAPYTPLLGATISHSSGQLLGRCGGPLLDCRHVLPGPSARQGETAGEAEVEAKIID